MNSAAPIPLPAEDQAPATALAVAGALTVDERLDLTVDEKLDLILRQNAQILAIAQELAAAVADTVAQVGPMLNGGLLGRLFGGNPNA